MSELHEDTVRRANDLYEELQGNPANTTQFKLDFLERLLDRAEKRMLHAIWSEAANMRSLSRST
jgi:hypothetical protein